MLLVATILALVLDVSCQSSQSVNPDNLLLNIPLWPVGQMPDSSGIYGPLQISSTGDITGVASPYLIMHTPQQSNGRAILVISGGGYRHIESGSESGAAANWLSQQGYTAFELIYWLPAEQWGSTLIAFQDGQRAIRIIRNMACRCTYDTSNIGVMGFSAGGHLAGILATTPQRILYKPVANRIACQLLYSLQRFSTLS